MKKKFRLISIDGVEYAWRYNDGCTCCCNGGTIKIWKNKTLVIEDGDFIKEDISITPHIIERYIRKFILGDTLIEFDDIKTSINDKKPGYVLIGKFQTAPKLLKNRPY